MSLTPKIAEIISDAFSLSSAQSQQIAMRINHEVCEAGNAQANIEDILRRSVAREDVEGEAGRLAAYQIALAIELQERPIAPLRKRVPVPA